MHRLTTWKNHCWHQAKPAHWEGAVGALLVTSMWIGAGLSLHKWFSSSSDIFPIRYFALNIIKCSQLLQVAPLWMESTVSLVCFGHNGCALLYYCSPQLVDVLFLFLLMCKHQGRCRGQMRSTDVQDFPSASPLLHRRPAELAEESHPGPWGCCHPPPRQRVAARRAVVCRSEVAIRRLAGRQHHARLSNIWEFLYVVYCNYHRASPAEFGLFELLQSKLQGSVFKG